ncbi:MAG: carboxypeptidase-like regulatory domain-containing protein [Pyrinomonadaceae bacterium]
MNKLIFVITALCLLFTLPFSISSQEVKSVLIDGSVLDENSAYVTDAELTVVDLATHRSYTTKSNEDGRYNIFLPPSSYQILVKKFGFCPEKRANINLNKDAKITVNLRLIACSIANVIVVGPEKQDSGSFDRIVFPYFQEEINLDKKGPTVNIQYGNKISNNGKVSYHEIIGPNKNKILVQLAYRNLRVTSQSIELSSKNSFTAIGEVTFEDGQTNRKFEEVSFSLESGLYKVLPQPIKSKRRR